MDCGLPPGVGGMGSFGGGIPMGTGGGLPLIPNIGIGPLPGGGADGVQMSEDVGAQGNVPSESYNALLQQLSSLGIGEGGLDAGGLPPNAQLTPFATGAEGLPSNAMMPPTEQTPSMIAAQNLFNSEQLNTAGLPGGVG